MFLSGDLAFGKGSLDLVALWPAAKRFRVSASKRGLPRLGELEAPPARVSCFKLEELREAVMKLPVRLSIGESVIIHQGQGSVRLVVDTLCFSDGLNFSSRSTYPETLQNVSYEREATRRVQVVVDNNTDEVQNAAQARGSLFSILRALGNTRRIPPARIAQEYEGVQDPAQKSRVFLPFGMAFSRPSFGFLTLTQTKESWRVLYVILCLYERVGTLALRIQHMEWAYDVIYEAVSKFNCFPTVYLWAHYHTSPDVYNNPTAKTFAAFNLHQSKLTTFPHPALG
ncbi:hypothetical protein CCUS01_00018 [Colletotrichum cuscutae]|uniref:Uncharacterized protein n=1 Tax=Colletotrichum cuscutae TaxID=1209917 RepID=A0AAI9YDQ1_9PEZI|nr:hypothetical protein CCUS01_00018 [Colletotrichum cuscutae]